MLNSNLPTDIRITASAEVPDDFNARYHCIAREYRYFFVENLLDVEKMREAQMGIVASLTGTDETFSQPIIARHAYTLEDIVYNKRFKDIIIWQDKKVHIDLKGIHDLHEIEVR